MSSTSLGSFTSIFSITFVSCLGCLKIQAAATMANPIIMAGQNRLYSTTFFCIAGYWWHAKSLPQYASEPQSLLVLHSLWLTLTSHPKKKSTMIIINMTTSPASDFRENLLNFRDQGNL